MRKLYAVIGDPVEHSISPAMHTAAFRAAGIDAEYVKIRVKPEELEDAVKGIRALGMAGANITIPHKVEVMKFLDGVDSLAKDIGAVNTIVNKDGHLIGHNTDGLGALESLRKVTNTENRKITILGAGGAARAIAFTLAMEGKTEHIALLNIEPKTSEKLAQEISKKTKADVSVALSSEKELGLQLEKTDILINCTPVGMHPKTDESLVPPSLLRKGMIVFDIVYNPIRTKLIQDAEKAGCKTITGENMLVLQGAKSFELWTGKKPDVKLMHAFVNAKLQPSKEKNIVLLGFMGTGKTVSGKIIAEKLGKDFIDLDTEIEKMAGMDIPAIFERFGEKRFRELEMEAIELHSQKRDAVISCGGGAVLNFLNMLRLRETSHLFLLKASPMEIVKRLRNEKNRPLLGLEEDEKERRIIEILEARKSFYEATGAIKVDTDGLTPEQVAGEIIKIIGGKRQ